MPLIYYILEMKLELKTAHNGRDLNCGKFFTQFQQNMTFDSNHLAEDLKTSDYRP